MKKSISLTIILLLVLTVFTGCTITIGNDSNSTKEEPAKVEEKEEKTTAAKEDKKESSNKTANLGSKYVDFDKRSFAVNGKVYTLGVTTLKEMIDDGVPFNKDDLQNAENNINKNTESQSFSIELEKYYTAQVRVMNDTGDNKKISDCKISYIYLPVNQDKKQDILSFAFPLTVTEDELVENAGKPTKKDEYKGDNNYVSNTYEYKKDSTKYYGSSGYTFQFVNGSLRYVTITYKP